MRESLHYVKGVYSTLHRYNPNFEHLESSVADVAMVDVPGVFICIPFCDSRCRNVSYLFVVGELYTCRRGLRSCLSLLKRQVRRPGL